MTQAGAVLCGAVKLHIRKELGRWLALLLAVGCRPDAEVEPRAPPVFSSEPAARAPATLEPVAVVELFTSEGCVNCPRADRVAHTLVQWAQQAGSRVYLLSYHVDYWNGMGHIDRFSSPVFSARQQWYLDRWGRVRAYTPQVIVGGTDERAGADAPGIGRSVLAALRQPANVGVALEVWRAERSIEVRYVIEPAHHRDYVTMALVQDTAETHVRSGENAGLRLEHVDLVRDAAWASVGTGEGTWGVELPRDYSSGHVVAYVQQAHTLRVLGAQRVPIR